VKITYHGNASQGEVILKKYIEKKSLKILIKKNSWSKIYFEFLKICKSVEALIAQKVERRTVKAEFRGSMPVSDHF